MVPNFLPFMLYLWDKNRIQNVHCIFKLQVIQSPDFKFDFLKEASSRSDDAVLKLQIIGEESC